MHRSEFLKELKTTFPELTNDINREGGLLHMEMVVFHKFIQRCIVINDIISLQESFRVAELSYRLGNKKLKNAIDVSLIEGLKFSENKSAWELLPKSLQELYLSFHGKIL